MYCVHLYDTVMEYNIVIVVMAVFSLDPSTRRSKVTVSYRAALDLEGWRIVLKNTFLCVVKSDLKLYL